MRLTKHAHATISLRKAGRTILIDPGALTSDARELVGRADVVLLTHDHFDHFDHDAVLAGLADNANLQVYGPTEAVRALDEFADRVQSVTAGDEFTAAGFHVAAYGSAHALIHPEIARVDNIGFLIDRTVLHPGDAYLVIDVAVDTLLVPTSGPWTKMGDAIDYIRTVGPRQSIQIHDVMLSEVGRASAGTFLGKQSLTGTTLMTLSVGESVTV